MSAILNTKRVAERTLLGLTPSVPIAFENVEFTPPDGMYLRCQFAIRTPDDPVFPAGYHRERIELQVFVVDKLGEGTAAVITKAEQIRDAFRKGITFSETGTNIYVLTTPRISGTMVLSDRVICPVLIDLVVEVYDY